MEQVYIDDILENEFIKLLSKKYNKEKREDILFIFFMRLYIINNYPDYTKFTILNSDVVSSFLHKELKLDDVFLYNTTIVKKNSYDIGNCTTNICDNWCWEFLSQFNLVGKIYFMEKNNTLNLIKILLNKYSENAERILKKFPKKALYRKEKFIQIMLEILKKDFDCQYNDTIQHNNISYKMFCNKKNIDDEINEKAMLFDKNNTYTLEIDVEKYVFQHITEIFPFIEKAQRQVVIKNNIIDILGYNKDEIIIIEIKNRKNPKDIIFQLENYKEHVKKLYPDKKVRILSITPVLNDDYIFQLNKIGAEIYFFTREKESFKIYKKQL